MKKTKFIKKVISLALVVAAMTACITSAFAATYEKSDSYKVDNIVYNVESILYIDTSTSFRAGVFITTADRANVPAYTLYAQAELMDSDGYAIESSRWELNSKPAYWISAVTDRYSTAESVYSRGRVRLGSDQVFFYAPTTQPYGGVQTVTENAELSEGLMIPESMLSTLSTDGSYHRTADGKTYGFALLAEVVGYEPDLIAAKGTNGLKGYIKNEDLNPEFTCEEDYANYLKNLETQNYKLPLYDLLGNIIGDYKISNNEEIVPNATSPEEVKNALRIEANGIEPEGLSPEDIKAYYAAQSSFTFDATTTYSNSLSVSPEEVQQNQIDKWLVNGEYKKTADGKTYGPTTLVGIVGTTPDLVPVQGMNGNTGFVKIEDYDPFYSCKTTEDFMECWQKYEQDKNRTIPVYDLDGNVIDKYKC